MDVVVLKGSIGIGEDLLDDIPSQVKSRIELPHIDSIAIQRDVAVFLTSPP